MTAQVMIIEDFKNALRGWARVRMLSGMILHDVGVTLRQRQQQGVGVCAIKGDDRP